MSDKVDDVTPSKEPSFLAGLDIEVGEEGVQVKNTPATNEPSGKEPRSKEEIEANPRDRVKTKDLPTREKVLTSYIAEHGVTLEEAMEALGMEVKGQKQAPAPEPEPDPGPDPVLEQHDQAIAANADSLKTIRDEIKQVKSDKAAALKDGNLEERDVLGDRLIELMQQETELKYEGKDLTREKSAYEKSLEIQRQEQADAAANAAQEKAYQRAMNKYPELKDSTSSFSQKCQQKYEELQASGDPILQSPQATVLIADSVAIEEGLQPASRRVKEQPKQEKANPFGQARPISPPPAGGESPLTDAPNPLEKVSEQLNDVLAGGGRSLDSLNPADLEKTLAQVSNALGDQNPFRGR